MDYPKIVDGALIVVAEFEEGCLDPLSLYSIAFINGEGGISFYGAETDAEFVALANHLGGSCTDVASATAYVHSLGHKPFFNGTAL